MTLPDDDEYDAHVSGTVPISSERESPITLRNVGIDTSMTRCTARYVVTHANPTAAPRYTSAANLRDSTGKREGAKSDSKWQLHHTSFE